MKHYIIDGNNLIGKIPELQKTHKKDQQASRIKLAYKIDSYFASRKAKVTLHFDGFAKEPIKIGFAKIIYSDSKSADEKIKSQIERIKNRKLIIVVTSDSNLAQFAKVCSSTVVSSESFAGLLNSRKNDPEASIIGKLEKEIDEFKRLFGASIEE